MTEKELNGLLIIVPGLTALFACTYFAIQIGRRKYFRLTNKFVAAKMVADGVDVHKSRWSNLPKTLRKLLSKSGNWRQDVHWFSVTCQGRDPVWLGIQPRGVFNYMEDEGGKNRRRLGKNERMMAALVSSRDGDFFYTFSFDFDLEKIGGGSVDVAENFFEHWRAG